MMMIQIDSFIGIYFSLNELKVDVPRPFYDDEQQVLSTQQAVPVNYLLLIFSRLEIDMLVSICSSFFYIYIYLYIYIYIYIYK